MKYHTFLVQLLTIPCIILLLLLHTGSLAYALSQPIFSSCLNPQGDLQVTHADGLHGVPGVTPDSPGVDMVYSQSGQSLLSSATVVQCLCPTNGLGVQTNWWKAGDLTDSEIATLKIQGWIYIIDGSVWGLDSTPYLAQNTGFSCNVGSQGTGPSGINGATTAPTTNATNGTASSLQAVLGAATQVAGELAATGNEMSLFVLISIGVTAIFLGLLLRKNT